MKPPAPLSAAHDVGCFDCGKEVMNRWLVERALKNHEQGATRTFVVCDDEGGVMAYYALAVGSYKRNDLPGKLSRGMPDPVPMVVLTRLAVDRRHQGKGLGRDLVADAVARALAVAEHAGVRGVAVSALDAQAAAFYRRLGFVKAKDADDVFMLRLRTALEVINAEAAI